MRLGQIKRNLGIEPSKVVSFLASKNVTITKHPNSKVTGEQLAWIINEFKPQPIEEEKKESKELNTEKVKIEEVAKTEIKKKTAPKKTKKEPVIGDVIELPKEPVKKDSINVDEEEIEVIRAPKVEIGGIKVLGKIDLPKPKVEEIVEEEEKSVEEVLVEITEEKDPLAHIHPSKRAKSKADKVLSELPLPKTMKTNSEVSKSDFKKKKAKELKAKELKAKNDNAPKSKKRKQIEKESKIKAAEKARKEQEYIKKHGAPKKKKVNSSQRIEVRSDGTIIPKHEIDNKSKETKPSLFTRFWKWFNR